MSSVVLDDTTHTDDGCALKEGSGNNGVCARNGIAAAGDGEDSVMDALNNLADASLYAGLITEISDVLAALSNDDTGFLGGNNGAQGQLSLGIFFVRLRGELAVGAESLVHLQLVHGVDDVAAIGRKDILGSCHDCCVGGKGEEGTEEMGRVRWRCGIRACCRDEKCLANDSSVYFRFKSSPPEPR